MVRFSDLLGGGHNDDEQGDAVPQATISEGSAADPYAALAGDVDDEPETPEDLLARLAEYAAMRHPEPVEPTASPPRPDVDLESSLADDLLPRKAR